MSEHPPMFRLDALAAGDRVDPAVAGHVTACEACTAYVRVLTAQAGEGSTTSAEFVLRLHDAIPPPSRFRRLSLVAGPLLLAAALLLFLRTRREEAITDPPHEPATRFKGKMQLAVVRDRNGEQSRLTTDVRVRAGDRLRVELSVDDARPLEVGFLGNDGTWVLLVAPTVIEAGTRFSERAARFDDSPTEGFILAGAPDAVTRARTTRAFDDISVIPVTAEP